MTELAPDPYSDPDEWTDTQCAFAGRELRRERLNAVSMTYTRMLRGLKRLGWEVTPEEYKGVERDPMKHLELIKGGLIKDATRVIRGDMPAYVHSDGFTQATMKVIKERRDSMDMGYDELAEAISKTGEPVTKDEYRTMEQGLNKNVPVSIVLRAADALEIPWDILFSVAQSNYQELHHAD